MKRKNYIKIWTLRVPISKYIAIFILSISTALGQTQVNTPEAIVFPAVGQSTYIVQSGQSLTAKSGQSITLKNGVHLMEGSNVLLQVDPSFQIPLAPNNPQANTDMNWILSRSFNALGQVVSEGKVFYDDLGKPIQQQVRNLEAGHVLASQPLYGVYGQAVGSTLSAPINNASFAYKNDFATTTSGTVYSFRNFGRYKNGSTTVDKTNTADLLGGTTAGTLGWYYSAGNNWEKYQDVTGYPYSMNTDASNGSGVFNRSASIGNELRMGKGHESISFSVPVTTELALYESIRNKYFTDAVIGGRTLQDSAQRNMAVSLDADRNIGISIAIDGRTVMTALGGSELTINKSIQVGTSGNVYFPILSSQSVTFSGASSALVDYVRNEQVSTVSSGAITLDKGLYELRTEVGGQTANYSMGLGTISMNFYDQLGRLKASIPPEGVKKLLNGGINSYAALASIPFVNTYEYDGLGRLAANTSPDQGRSELKYNMEGKVRFSQNALQKQKGSYSYTNYDQYGRVLQSGEYLPSATGVKFESISQVMLDATGLPSTVGTQSDVNEIHYDEVNASHGLTAYVQDSYFLGGAVSYTEKYSQLAGNVKDETKLVNRTWYNYDGDGNISWSISLIQGLGNKTMDYTYDEFGRVVKAIYQKGTTTETFVHYYEYNQNGNLKAVYTNTVDNTNSKAVHAKYSYYLTGALKRIEYGDKLQGVDYVYTVDGKLKSINNADIANDPGKDGGNGFAKDVFSLNLEYYANDYSRTGVNINSIQNATAPARYAGLINGLSWQTQKPSSVTGLDAAVMNVFNYDVKGQLLNSTWGNPNYTTKTFTGLSNVNQEKGLSYDGHGNILALQRTNVAGALADNFTYTYQANTNKLTSVPGYATYTYDAIGQLASQVKGTVGMYMDYDVTGKVTKIYSDIGKTTIILSFMYDDAGNRILKKDHRTGLNTWYSYDAGGSLMAIFDNQGVAGALQLIEQPVYGSGNLGTFIRQGGSYRYTLTDHLGNTRAVVNRNKLSSGNTDVLYYADYYPFGMEVRSGGIDNRYGYQGLYAEKDKETGWNNFELRNYDAAVGRWLTTDPYGQYNSPYVGMGNNPVSGFDPNGGWNIGGWFKSLFDGGGEKIKHYTIDEVVITRFYNKSQITPEKQNFLKTWGNNKIFFIRGLYSLFDDPYVYFTGFGNINNARHLGGYGADPNEYRTAGVITIASALGPIASEAKAMTAVTSAAPALTLVDDAAKGGKDIVGTKFNEVLPTQDYINPLKVEEYKSLIQSGAKVPASEAYRVGERIFLEEGHHRFVAHMQLGLKPPLIIRNTGGPVGFPNWLNTTYQLHH
ncbi:RHS repeat-associated core domain-containing protein [Sphingobacterium sp. SRCM116780]|uniref:RHS repeat domain-containing protein n=1 Tax=Sphingobacterium sp. SRCM116780 TaxID=2907623 RepID=UPI001F2B3352|nr:RHS repeat-associated core domain-containing protein [Sphingobacterium sp. SRCM116780]UIR54609.1 RHS repeat-associated core domain-containing protein [Sphingobacterium sp. SRCM116780]